MGTNLKILTLNCWGVFVPGICQYRHERMDAICQGLAEGRYDIVLLQEVWTQSDYEKLCTKIGTIMQHTHYFSSGVFGGGLCIFSKFPILETFQHNFSLNGYAHKIIHGDWFGGKCIGLAKLLVRDFRVNVYVTHTHACYKVPDREYFAHRLAQAHELSQFVKLTSDACDAVIVGGDFNFTPTDLGYKMIRCNANLKDAWIDQREPPEDEWEGQTCDRPDNPFASPAALASSPNGSRLDYLLYRSNSGHVGTVDRPDNTFHPQSKLPDGQCIDFLMFRANAGCELICEKSCLTMRKIPELGYNYSDHEGVMADFTLKRNITAMGTTRNSGEVEKNFSESLPLLDDGMKQVKANQVYHVVLLFVCLVALTFTGSLQPWFGFAWLLGIVRLCLTLTTGFCFWSAVVMANRELNALSAARKDINNLLRSNPLI